MEPAAIRYKNPGAMWPNAIATKWGSTRWVYLNDGTGQGGNGKGNKIAIFDNWVDGICAQMELWKSSKNYRNQRFADAIAVWSGHNNVPSYIAYLKARVPGLDEDTVMDDTFWRGPMAIPFLKAQAGHEAGRAIPASDADYKEAQRRVTSGKALQAPRKPADATIPIVVGTTTGTAAHTSGFPIWAAVLVGIGALLAFVAVKVYINYRKVKALDKEIEELSKAIPNDSASAQQVQEHNGELSPERAVLRGEPVGQVPSPVHVEGSGPSGLSEPVPPVHGS